MGATIKPTLGILAAGLGRRYDSLKQMEPVYNDNILLEYAIYDALQAGFGKVVLLIRRDFEDEFMKKHGGRIEAWLDKLGAKVGYAHQPSLDDIQQDYPWRGRMWGTGYATLMFKDTITEPFVVINADDFYGRKSFELLYDFFNSGYDSNGNIHAMVAFPLKKVVSTHGYVARGACELSEDGYLERIVEIERIRVDGEQVVYLDGEKEHPLDPDTPTSMNMWAFNPTIFSKLQEGFEEFESRVKKHRDAKSEYYLPSFVDSMIDEQLARVKVLSTSEQWFGMTHREDRSFVRNAIQAMIDAGVYPDKLWY